MRIPIFFILICVITSRAELVFEPGTIKENIDSGEQWEEIIIVWNNGERAVRFRICCEIIGEPDNRDLNNQQFQKIESLPPSRDDPGQIIAQYERILNYTHGLTSTMDGHIYGCSTSEVRVRAINVENGEIVADWECCSQPYSIEWVKNEFWINEYPTGRIFRYDREGELLGQFEIEIQRIIGMAYDGRNRILINSFIDDTIHILNLENLQEVGEIEYHPATENRRIYDIKWIEAHKGGHLWGINRGAMIQINVDEEGNTSNIQTIETDFRESSGLAHDGEHMWIGGYRPNIWAQIDDGVEEIYWITCDPKEGEVEADGEFELVLNFNSAWMNNGVYEFRIVVSTDEDGNSEYRIRILLNASELSQCEDDVSLPDNLKLSTFPNPFNSSTTISYTLQQPLPISLQVFGINGRLIETLVDGVMSTGRQSVVWDADGFGAGVYFVRIKDEYGMMKEEIQKVTLLK